MTWKKIILHHSATADGQTNDWQSIKNWHTGKTGSDDIKSPCFNPYKVKPMLDIGYHYGLELENDILMTRIGRPLTMVGAHTLGQNAIAIGICIVGNFDIAEPSHEQYMAVAVLCSTLVRLFSIPKIEIHGHNEYALKTCPGKLFDLEKVRSLII